MFIAPNGSFHPAYRRFQQQALVQKRNMKFRQQTFIRTYMNDTYKRSQLLRSKCIPQMLPISETAPELELSTSLLQPLPNAKEPLLLKKRRRCILTRIFDTSPNFPKANKSCL